MIYIVGIIILSILLRVFVYTNFSVQGESMYPTYEDKDVVFTTKISSIERFDTIVFKDETTGNTLIKRVIGFGGENIAYIDNELRINGEKVEEPYKVKLGKFANTKDFNTMMLYKGELEERCYFVLGDNRSNSKDSRSTDVGCVKPENIQGEVKLKLWGNF